jgi:hypothetical protein
MIKQFISFKSPSGNPVSRTLHFHLDEFEVSHDMELEVLKERLERFQDEVIGDDKTLVRELTAPEKREMLDIVKVLIKHSYGVRSQGPDGEQFDKDDPHGSGDIWRRFVSTGAFNAFVLYLFENTDRANYFMTKIWPEVVQKDYEKSQRADLSPVPDLENPLTNVANEAPVYPGDDGIPSIDSPEQNHGDPLYMDNPVKKTWSDYTPDQLLEMNRNEFETLYAEARQGKNIPTMLLNIRQRRKMAEGAEEPGGTTE